MANNTENTKTIRWGIYPIILSNEEGETELFIEHPENVQLHHVERIREHLLGKSKHPSNGLTASHTSWVMDKILGNVLT